MCFIASLLLREKLGVGGPSQLGSAVPGEGLGSWVCLTFSRPLRWGYFLSHWMCSCLSTGFWIPLRGDLSACSCILGVPVGRTRVRSVLVLRLASFPSFSPKTFNWLHEAHPHYGDYLLYSKSTNLYINLFLKISSQLHLGWYLSKYLGITIQPNWHIKLTIIVFYPLFQNWI